MSSRARESWLLLEAEEGKEMILSQSFLKECRDTDTLMCGLLTSRALR